MRSHCGSLGSSITLLVSRRGPPRLTQCDYGPLSDPVAWTSTDGDFPGQKLHEPPEQREERLFLLRPFVFAAQRYELCYAPWTIQDLPISTATQPSPIRQLIPGPFVADLAPRSRVVTIEYYGRKMELCPPILAHAAILRFFAKKLRTNVNQPGQNGVLRGVDPYPGLPGRYVNGDDDSEDEGDDDEEEEEAGGSVINDSRQHDRDFTRLISCYDPSVCRGMKRASWRGSWDGCWEGKFSFFDFDAFRDMLAGQSRALYEGSFGEQAQVWRLKETYVRPVGHKGTKGKGKGKAGGLPLKGPMTNAGFPTDQPSSTGAGLGTPAAEEKTMRETINQQVDAIQGYEIVPDDEVDEALSDDRGEEEGLEMLLTGTGHSAWGPFILKGRVRAWDGMASLVKEYAVSRAIRLIASHHLNFLGAQADATMLARLPRQVDLPRVHTLWRRLRREMARYFHARDTRRIRRDIHPEPSLGFPITAAIRSTTLLVRSFTTPSISIFSTPHASTPSKSISSNRSTCRSVSICASVIFPLAGRAATTR